MTARSFPVRFPSAVPCLHEPGWVGAGERFGDTLIADTSTGFLLTVQTLTWVSGMDRFHEKDSQPTACGI